ncbi:hypothetical protein MHYP_G00350470 [Metynnis hypsauchen]
MWIPTEDEKFGVVISSFRSSVSQSLVLELGETVQILEKCEAWYRGFSTKRPTVKGIFPTNYVHLKKATVTNRGQCETVVPLEDPIITESTSTLQEWGVLWKQLYVKHRVELFQKLCHVMNELMDLRRQLISGHMTQEQSREVKRHITLRLDWGNEHLGLDLVPRKEFEMVDPDQFSVSDLYKMSYSWTISDHLINRWFWLYILDKNTRGLWSVYTVTGSGQEPMKTSKCCKDNSKAKVSSIVE